MIIILLFNSIKVEIPLHVTKQVNIFLGRKEKTLRLLKLYSAEEETDHGRLYSAIVTMPAVKVSTLRLLLLFEL